MPLMLELTPAQQAVFAEISDELAQQWLRSRTVRHAQRRRESRPGGSGASQVEHMLHELLEQFAREEQKLNLEAIRTRIAASIACHAAIKVNMPLEQNKMEWLLAELAKTELPDVLPPRKARSSALLDEGYSEGVQENLETVAVVSLQPMQSAQPRCHARIR